MKVLVLSLTLVAALAADPEKPFWANEDTYGHEQDAWTSLQGDLTSNYYLVKSTALSDPVWGNNFTCVSVRATSKNDGEKSIQAVIKYKAQEDQALHITEEKIYAVSHYNYQKANAIKYVTKAGELTDVLAYSNGASCDVYYVPPTQDYELWATNIEDIAKECTEKFKAYSTKKEARDVYTIDCE
uniref:Lipocalin n=1 Tax=Rhipicephalus appendiculatus TaxID=34631 RepID=A0A131YEY4_RHIAP